MSESAAHFLFQIYNRRGLGHLVRASNLARAIRELEPAARITFFARGAPPPGYVASGVTSMVERDDDQWFQRWSDCVRSVAPDVLVYDTMLPGEAGHEPAPPGAGRAYVMRRCKPERQAAVFASAALSRMDLILVPHSREEFGYAVPAPAAGRTAFVGPIVRPLNPSAADRLRSTYDIEEGTFLLTSTAGGGGFAADTSHFLDVVSRADELLRPDMPRLRHVIVAGPRFTGKLPDKDGVFAVRTEPDLVDLLGLSRVTIASGGYNTVNEIRQSGVPAAFLPGSRTHDDQAERVERLCRAGLAFTPDPGPTDSMARAIAEFCRSGPNLEAMRRRCADHRLVPGNDAAAELLLKLAGR
jgi:predicted glycosyltransferase